MGSMVSSAIGTTFIFQHDVFYVAHEVGHIKLFYLLGIFHRTHIYADLK